MPKCQYDINNYYQIKNNANNKPPTANQQLRADIIEKGISD